MCFNISYQPSHSAIKQPVFILVECPPPPLFLISSTLQLSPSLIPLLFPSLSLSPSFHYCSHLSLPLSFHYCSHLSLSPSLIPLLFPSLSLPLSFHYCSHLSLSLCPGQEAEVGGTKPPEPFDVRMEQAEEAGGLLAAESAGSLKPPKSPVRSLTSSLNCTLPDTA